MARVNRVKKSRKVPGTCGKCGEPIQVGDPYIWWKFRYGGKRIRCVKYPSCYPFRSDLTQSDILATIWDLQDELQASISGADLDTLPEILNEAAERIRGEVCQDLFQEKIDNIMEHFPYGNPTTEDLEDRMYELESWADGLESAASEVESKLEEAMEYVDEAEGEELELPQDEEQEIRSLAEDAVSQCPE